MPYICMLADWMQLRGGEGQGLTKKLLHTRYGNTINILDIWSKFTTLCDRLWGKAQIALGRYYRTLQKGAKAKEGIKITEKIKVNDRIVNDEQFLN